MLSRSSRFGPRTWSGLAPPRSSSRTVVGVELGLPVFLYGEVGARTRAGVLPPRRDRRAAAADRCRRARTGLRASAARPVGRRAIVGARRPLIAFNVNLVGANVEAAREIAAVVRERDGGFPGVRALGLDLPDAGQAQVSMNVEDWEAWRCTRSSRRSSARQRRAASRSRAGARRPHARGRGGRSSGRAAADRRLRRVAFARAAPARSLGGLFA